jgi:non-ribosomal peptide synthetase component F
VLVEQPEVESCSALVRVLSGGEPLSAALVRRFYERLPRATLFHMYGPTETVVAVTAGRCGTADAKPRIPLGRPVANTRMYVLDADGEPVPVGVVGELHVGGAQMARGYLSRSRLTAERFVPDPFGQDTGARLYRTGDTGRWLADGTIEFLGRNDDQVKVRGRRIELGEIEARLIEYAGVRGAAVLVREDRPGDHRVVAYIVAAGDLDAEALKAHLSKGLPAYMVPSAYVMLDVLPLTPNGKVNRRALPAPVGNAYATRAYEAPLGDIEMELAEIWVDVLGVERVGRHDHFFELGGHSLLAAKLVERVQQQLQVDIALRDIFEMPLLSRLADHVVEAQLAQYDPAELARIADAMRESSGP